MFPTKFVKWLFEIQNIYFPLEQYYKWSNNRFTYGKLPVKMLKENFESS